MVSSQGSLDVVHIKPFASSLSHLFILNYIFCVDRFIDRENELRQSKPPTPQPPQRAPLDPWTRSRLSRQFAPPKEEKSSDSEN